MKTTIVPILIAVIAWSCWADKVYTETSQGNQLYKKGQYGEALQHYDNALKEAPKDPKLHMNRGAALYQLNRYDRADSEYVSPEGLDKNKKALGDFYYNKGNILYKQAQQSEQSGGQNASELYKGALENYIKALDVRPNDKDTKWNLQLAQVRMKQAQQKQQQQQQNKDNKQDKKDQKKQQDKNQDQQKKQDKQDQQKQQQDQQKQDQQKQEQQKQQKQQSAEEKQKDMKKEEAVRLIQQYSDDANNLNKPIQVKGGKERKMEKDW